MRTWILILLAWLGMANLTAQGWTAADELGNREVGLRLGTGVYGIFGGELKNPTPKIGFQAGFHWYGSKPEKRLNWQTGLEASFTGSNFKNEDTFGLISNSHYSQLGIIQVDVPLLLNIRLKPFSDKGYNCLQIGILPGAILSSVIYVGSEKTPVQQTNLQPWKNLPLKPINLSGVIGYQKTGPQVGFSFRLKMSLLDLNDNFVLPSLLPATGTGKRIGVWGIETAMLF
jgi:hypothetical protein